MVVVVVMVVMMVCVCVCEERGGEGAFRSIGLLFFLLFSLLSRKVEPIVPSLSPSPTSPQLAE
jgi:hypothetical protein